MDLFNQYMQEIQEDVKFDQINILEKQLSLPAIKHKWVARLMSNKRIKNKLEQKKVDLKEEVLKTLTEKGIPSGIPKAALASKVDASETIKKINNDIDETELLIEYLEKVEKIMSSLTYDIGNATKIMTLETT
jgi:hypothetical protein